MKIIYPLKRLGKLMAGAFAGESPEEFLESVYCELTRRNFVVERYKDVSGRGIRGNSGIYPSVLVNVYVLFTAARELQACLFFKEDNQLDLVCRANPDFKKKVAARYFSLPIDAREIARELNTDALLLGALLETILKRQKIERRHA